MKTRCTEELALATRRKLSSEGANDAAIIIIVYYVSRRIMGVIMRRASMLAGNRSRGAISPPNILSESLNYSLNYSNCVHWHIFYFM